MIVHGYKVKIENVGYSYARLAIYERVVLFKFISFWLFYCYSYSKDRSHVRNNMFPNEMINWAEGAILQQQEYDKAWNNYKNDKTKK